jgi:hypothetical protein
LAELSTGRGEAAGLETSIGFTRSAAFAVSLGLGAPPGFARSGVVVIGAAGGRAWSTASGAPRVMAPGFAPPVGGEAAVAAAGGFADALRTVAARAARFR